MRSNAGSSAHVVRGQRRLKKQNKTTYVCFCLVYAELLTKIQVLLYRLLFQFLMILPHISILSFENTVVWLSEEGTLSKMPQRFIFQIRLHWIKLNFINPKLENCTNATLLHWRLLILYVSFSSFSFSWLFLPKSASTLLVVSSISASYWLVFWTVLTVIDYCNPDCFSWHVKLG